METATVSMDTFVQDSTAHAFPLINAPRTLVVKMKSPQSVPPLALSQIVRLYIEIQDQL